MAFTVARLVRTVASLIALLIVAAILLFVLGANHGNGIVRDVHDAAAWFAGPFKTLFSIHRAKVGMAVNWGLAALAYLVVGHVIATLIARAGTPRRRARRRPVAV